MIRGALLPVLVYAALTGPQQRVLCAGPATGGFVRAIEAVQPKMVKIFGAGGIRGLEAYQSGFLISPEGHVLTSFSYVLDTDAVTVILHDGRKSFAQLVGTDPVSELAVLKIEVTDLDFFDLDKSIDLQAGDRVLAFSNLYGVATGNEPTSVQHGTLAAVSQLATRRGAFRTPYRGPIYVLDAMTNNAGAAGGALTDVDGRLAGILGKELRSSAQNVWLNYAFPITAVRDAVRRVRAGESPADSEQRSVQLARRPWTLPRLGVQLVPDLLPKTPPFVEFVASDSPAGKAGLRSDDLIVSVEDRLVRSFKATVDELARWENDESLTLTVLRSQELISLTVEPLE